MPPATVPDALIGLWRRELITAPGLRDEATRVAWLQTRSWYVDLRAPADRPDACGRRSFAQFSDDELLALARVEGFAGELTVRDGVCAWRRDLDHQPPGPLPDEGRYSLDGEVMIETGVHADYREVWRRAPRSGSPLLAFRLEDARDGLLVVAGRHMLAFVARPGPAPTGASLKDLVAAELAAGRRANAEALLGSDIRYACAEADGAWTVRLSSLPWREGEPMWPQGAGFDPASGRLEAGSERWRLLDASPGSAPAMAARPPPLET